MNAMVAGDIDANGTEDLVLGGAYPWDVVGEVGVFYGPVGGELTLDAADATLLGENEHSELGDAMTPLGDANDDGFADFAIGSSGAAPSASDEDLRSGVIYVLFGGSR